MAMASFGAGAQTQSAHISVSGPGSGGGNWVVPEDFMPCILGIWIPSDDKVPNVMSCYSTSVNFHLLEEYTEEIFFRYLN